MTYDLAALERRFYKSSGKPRLTPEILGKIVAAAWKRRHPDSHAFPTYDQLTGIIVAKLQSAPKSVAEVLKVEQRPDGTKVEELTRMVIGAQNAGVLARANPQNAHTYIKTDLMQSYAMLDSYEAEFSDAVKWAENAIDTLPDNAA